MRPGGAQRLRGVSISLFIHWTGRNLIKAVPWLAPDMRQKLLGLGAEPVGNAAEQFAAQMKVQIDKCISVARPANIKAE